MSKQPRVTIRKKVSDAGWPVHTRSGAISSKWRKAHPAANVSARKKYGSKKAKQISRLVKQIPKGELLGKHTRAGKIIISAKVPAKLRPAIIHHEKVESKIMRGKG